MSPAASHSATVTSFSLWFGGVEIGAVSNVTFSDNSGYGLFTASAAGASEPAAKRALAYAKFSEDWNEREAADQDPSPKEFDAYADVTDPKLWHLRDAQGARLALAQAPVFFPGNEVSWGMAD